MEWNRKVGKPEKQDVETLKKAISQDMTVLLSNLYFIKLLNKYNVSVPIKKKIK